jgi:hypothetical protein
MGTASIHPAFIGDGFLFVNSNDAVTFGSTAGQFGTKDFTIDFWVQTSGGTEGLTLTLMEKREACTFGSFWGLRVESSGVVHAEIDDPGNYVSFDGATNIADDNWHHVALVRKGTKLSLYVDGKLDGSQTSPAVVNIGNTAPFTAGAGVCNVPLIGFIDEIQVFNRALSAAQIQAIHNAGSGGTCK